MLDMKKSLDSLIKRKTIQQLNYSSAEFNESLEGIKNIFLDSLRKSNDSDLVKYINQSAEEVDKRYTEISYEEGERIKNSLDKVLDNIDFEYQGSVSNNTHIRATSDLDLLVILRPYDVPNENLLQLKDNCHSNIKTNFPKVNIERGAKSLKLTGGSLRRDIDVVPSCWNEKTKPKKGIAILNEEENSQVINTPFYHNQLLNQKDEHCKFFYKKAIRLIKNLKADIEEQENKELKISSYEITALIYHISDDKFSTLKQNTELVPMLVKEFNLLLSREDLKELEVPDGSRKIIKNKETIISLQELIQKLSYILNCLEKEKNQSVKYEQVKATPKAWGN